MKAPGNRRLFGLVTGLVLGATAVGLWADEPLVPSNVGPDRYQLIWTRSPFGPPSASVDERSSAKWQLEGIAGSPKSYIVFLQNKETQERQTVTETVNDKGFQIVACDPQSDLFESSVTVHTPDGDVLVKFDRDQVNAAPGGMPNGQMPQMFTGPVPTQISQPMPLQSRVMPMNPNRLTHHIVIPSPPPPPAASPAQP